ncbi:putative colanic acid biosynthesis acetyltransferase WcaF [Catalinimonas alkaloidigena]|uniref:Putative colanic acid biosynthesis acetyltransferase WcaF n=1 Tax=Catalinimonas alkaloidigena TaxID=1075417 RepID=A0A1G9J2Z7_9BACT|nr:WcaF family extracellular polysaccharide biosynthesis acetyltransferase [Catalinimonas alkaloidigena]SDL31877.1 putative colanic acid biosynthesis acetyltransferase WcaF [Catalinimonas alkaloidigena]
MRAMVEKHFISQVKLKEFNPSVGLDRGVAKWKEGFWYVVKIVFFLSALPYPHHLKASILRLFGAHVGSRVVIKPRVNIHFPWKLEIGDDVWIGEEAFILNFEPVRIGSNVCISQRAFLCGGNHDFRVPSMPYRNGPITLQDGCWIGAGCFIGPGVTVGTDTVVTVGSIVTSDLGANRICRVHPPAFEKIRWRSEIDISK